MDPANWTLDEFVNQIDDTSSQLHSQIQISPLLNLQNLREQLIDNDMAGEALLTLEDVNIQNDHKINSLGQRREVQTNSQPWQPVPPAAGDHVG